MNRPTYASASTAELRRWADSGDATASQWLIAFDEEDRDAALLDHRDFSDSMIGQWDRKPMPPAPRPRWLGLQAISDGFLFAAAVAVILALCAAFYGRAIVELFAGVVR